MMTFLVIKKKKKNFLFLRVTKLVKVLEYLSTDLDVKINQHILNDDDLAQVYKRIPHYHKATLITCKGILEN